LSIRTWVFLSATLAALPVGVVVVLDDVRAYHVDVEAAEHAAGDAVDTLSARQSGIVSETHRLLGALSAFPEIQRRDPEASSALLSRVLEKYPGYTALVADGPEGLVFASGKAFPNPPRVTDRKFYQDVVATHDCAVGEYAISRSAAQPVIHYAHPVLDPAGQLLAILQVGYDLAHLETLFGGVGLPAGSAVVAADHAGTVLYHSTLRKRALGRPDDPATFARMKAGQARETVYLAAADGTRNLVVYNRLGLKPGGPTYMYLRAEIPEARITERADAVLRRDLLILLSTVALALACAWFVGDRLVARRLKQVAAAAGRMASGDLAARSELVHDETEVGRLARAFDAMSAAVEGQTRKLQASEAERRAGEEFLATTLLSIGDGVVVTDEAGRVVRMNPVAEALSGTTLEQAQGKPVTEILRLVKGGTDEPADDPVSRVLREGVVVGLANHTELIARDGTRRQIADSAAPIRAPGSSAPRGVVMVFRDVTERYRLEDQIKQAQKMETVGRLAGGIAHDFNNLLVAILGGSDLIEQTEGLDSDTRAIAAGVREAATRGAELTRSLLAYARKSPSMVKPMDAHEAIAGALKVLSRTIDRGVAVQSELKAESAVVKGDATQLQQMVINLGLNARDAMPQGGTFRIATRNVLLAPSDCAALDPQLKPGEFLEILLADDGTGMSAEATAHLFEPFFTTKAPGQGTGLGLPAVYGTVRSHGGWIGVETAPGKGTKFRVLLPLSEAGLEKKAPEKRAEKAAVRGSGRVLLADDEPTVRLFAQTVIEQLGYQVTAAKDGEEAVRLFQEAGGQFAAVVLDMVMPRMNGIATFEALCALAPQLHAVISSGYHDDPKVQELAASGRVLFLAKPYTAAGLGEAVAAVAKRAVPKATS
jgi:PAS domain S-box-containing protein